MIHILVVRRDPMQKVEFIYLLMHGMSYILMVYS